MDVLHTRGLWYYFCMKTVNFAVSFINFGTIAHLVTIYTVELCRFCGIYSYTVIITWRYGHDILGNLSHISGNQPLRLQKSPSSSPVFLAYKKLPVRPIRHCVQYSDIVVRVQNEIHCCIHHFHGGRNEL